MSDSAFLSFLKEQRGKWKLVLLFLAGILLLILGFSSRTAEAELADPSLDEYRKGMESELSDFLEKIDGVGDAEVLITLLHGESKEYRGQELVGITGAEVYSVTVICEGGGRDEIKGRLTQMLTAQFGIGANRICILPIK